jgi:hypothetical protein
LTVSTPRELVAYVGAASLNSHVVFKLTTTGP